MLREEACLVTANPNGPTNLFQWPTYPAYPWMVERREDWQTLLLS